MQTIFVVVGWMLATSLSVIERLHARNRNGFDERGSWHHFIDYFVGAEVREVERIRDETRQAHEARSRLAIAPPEVPIVPPEVPIAPPEVPIAPPEVPIAPPEVPIPPPEVPIPHGKAQSAYEIFKRRWLDEQKMLGRTLVVTKITGECTAAFGALPAEQRQAYEVQAAASLAASALRRQARRRIANEANAVPLAAPPDQIVPAPAFAEGSEAAVPIESLPVAVAEWFGAQTGEQPFDPDAIVGELSPCCGEHRPAFHSTKLEAFV